MMPIDTRMMMRGAWALTAAALALGYGTIWLPNQRELAQIHERAHDLYERANRNEQIVRRSQRLHAIETRVKADLGRLEGQTTSGKATASALQVLDFESKAYGVDVRAVVPDGAAETSEAIGASRLVGQNVALDLRGRFRNIIAFLTDVPRHGVLLEVRGARLASVGSARGVPAPVLHASIQTRLYRVTASRLEDHDASTITR